MHEAPPAPPADTPPKGRWKAYVWGGLGVMLIPLAIVLWPRRPAEASGPSNDAPTFDGKALRMSPKFVTRAGIKTEEVKREAMTPTVRVVGSVTFNPAAVGAAGARIKGFVRKVYKVEGDEVKAGEALAEIESVELGEAQTEVAVAQARRKTAEANAQRESGLLERQLTTAREAEEAALVLSERKAAQAAAQQRVTALGGSKSQFGVYVVRAPIDGHIVERQLNVGQTVQGETVAFRVADLSKLWVELAVFERNIAAVRDNDRVEVTPLADSSLTIEGRVNHIERVIDEATRSAHVRVVVDNSAGKLRPGQSVQATLHTSGPTHDVVSVPDTAVTFVDGKPTVFIAETPERVIPVTVKLGPTDGKRQAISEGVQPGQQVVVAGVFALKSELFR